MYNLKGWTTRENGEHKRQVQRKILGDWTNWAKWHSKKVIESKIWIKYSEYIMLKC